LLRDVTIGPSRFRGLQVVVGGIELEHSLSYNGITPRFRGLQVVALPCREESDLVLQWHHPGLGDYKTPSS